MVGVNLQDVCGDGDDGEKKEGGECEDGSRFGLIDSLSLGTRTRTSDDQHNRATQQSSVCTDGNDSFQGAICSILMQQLRFLAQDRIIVLPSCCLLKHRSRVDICRVLR
jgi:hypothetical protein